MQRLLFSLGPYLQTEFELDPDTFRQSWSLGGYFQLFSESLKQSTVLCKEERTAALMAQ